MTLKPIFNAITGKFDFVQILTGYVPYTGATANVDLGAHSLAVNNIVVDSTGTEALLVRQDGDAEDFLVVDTQNKRIGIGLGQTATTPQKLLDISGDIHFTPVIAPEAVFTLTEDAGAYNLTAGVYWYYITYYTADGDADVGNQVTDYKKSITIAAANARVLITDVPVSADPRVIGRKVYRTLVDGNQYLAYLVDMIANNTDTTYTDNVADVALDTTDSAYRKDNGTIKGFYYYFAGTSSLIGKLGVWNLAFGYQTLQSLTSGFANFGFGYNVMPSATTARENVGIGDATWNSLITGSYNVGVGGVGFNQQAGNFNTGIGGANTLRLASAGSVSGNTALGYASMYMIPTGSDYNVCVGFESGYNFGGDYNILLGYRVGKLGASATIGTDNIFLGRQAGDNAAAGADNNILIGRLLDLDTANGDNQLNIAGILKGLSTSGSECLSLPLDKPFYFGAANDALVQYDGTNLIIDPDAVGSGVVKIGATADDNLEAAYLGLGVASSSTYRINAAGRIYAHNGAYYADIACTSGTNYAGLFSDGTRTVRFCDNAYAVNVLNGVSNFAGTVYITGTNRLYFGTGGALNIYNDGTNSLIAENVPGNIELIPYSGSYVVLASSKATTGDPTGKEGMVYINTTDNVVRMYADGAWRTLASW